MATRRRLLTRAASGTGSAVLLAWLASAQPATSSAAWELPDATRSALAEIRDFSFNFDQPGFYAVVEFVKHNPRGPGFAQVPIEVRDWRELLERPSEFRGRPVTIDGVIGRNKDPYTLASRPELGELWQLELRRDDQPLTCTLILTGGAADLPLGATVTITGYFVMIRQYYGPSNRAQPVALIVSPGPTAITHRAPSIPAVRDWRWMATAVLGGVAIAAFLLWRTTRAAPQSVHSLHASRQAPINLSDDLASWAEHERHDDH